MKIQHNSKQFGTSNFLLSLTLLCLILTANTVHSQTTSLDLTPAEQDWIKQHRRVTVGVEGIRPPIDFLDQNGNHRGITADIIAAVGEMTGIEFVPKTEKNWSEVMDQAQAGNIDLIASFAKNEQRKQFWDYTHSYYKSPYVICTRDIQPTVASLNDLYGKTVAVERGFSLQRKLTDQHPKIKLLLFDTTAQALEAVSHQQADAYIGNQTVIFYLAQTLRLSNLKVAANAGLSPGRLYFGVRKDWPVLTSIINKVLRALPRQQLQEIEQRWMGQPIGTSPEPQSDTASSRKFWLTADETAWLATQPKLRVGIMQSWPPISEMTANGQTRGIDVDIIDQLNQRLDGRLQIVPGPWNRIYQEIQQGDLDLLMGITPRDFRKPLMNFTSAYLRVPHIIVTRDSIADFFADESSLAGKTVALEKNFVNVTYFEQNVPQAKINTYPDTLAALEAVSRGDADAYAGSRLVVLHLIETQLLTNLKIHGRLSKPPTELAIASRKDAPLLASIMQKTINDLGEENIRQIILKWVNIDDPDTLSARLTLPTDQQAWIRQHPVVKVGVMANWPPFNFIDDNLRPRGIGADLLKELEQLLNLEFETVSGDWADIYQQTQKGQLDLLLDITPKKEREAFFNFTTPYLDVPHVIVARTDGERFHSEGFLRNRTLALEDSFGNVKYFQKNYPHVTLKLYPDTEQALEAVSRGDADAYAGNRVVALYLIEKLALSNLQVHGRLNKSGSILAIGTRKDYPLLRDILQNALDHIGESRVREIKNSWIYLTSTPAHDKIQLTAEEVQWLQEHPIIPIGIDGNWPPIDFMDHNLEHSGITADYLKLIGEKLGVRFVPQRSDSFSVMLNRVMDGNLKVGATISYREERAESLLFTRPFFHVQKVILVRDAQQAINDISDLRGKTVVIEDGFLTMRQLQERHPEIKLLPVATTRDALEKLSWGEADAYIGNQAVAAWIAREQQLDNLKIVSDAGLGSGPQNFAVSRKHPQWFPLVGIIDKVLDSISLEERVQIENRWINPGTAEETRPPRLALSNELRQWLDQHQQIRIGIDTQWPPLEYLDENGQYQGLSSDYMNHLSKRLGVEYAPPQSIPWAEVLEGLQQKTIDLAPLLIRTEEREAYLNFTKPYLNFPVVIFNQRGNTLLNGLADLIGKKVGIVKGYAIGELIARDFPDIEIVPVGGTTEGLQALSVGQIDAYIDVLSVGAYIMASNGMTNLQVAASTPYAHEFSIGVRKDWPQLVEILNLAIDSIPETTKNDFLRKWLVVRYEKKIDYQLLFWALGIFLLILTLLLLRARMMARVNTQLREGRQRLELSLEAAELGTFELQFPRNAAARMLWDETFSRHHRLPLDPFEIHSKEAFFKHIHPDHVADIHQRMARCLKGLTPDLVAEYQTADAERWLVTRGRVIQRENSGRATLLVGVTQDITRNVEAQEAIVQSSEFKSRFLANMSHEIRTPMNAIVGLSYLLSQTRMDNQQRDYVVTLQNSAKILLNLIDDILDLSKIEANQMSIDQTDFNLADLLQQLAEMTRVRIDEKQVEFLYDIDHRIPDDLRGDPLRLTQILNNLLSNAAKFTETGHIILRVSLEEQVSDRHWLLFSVIDTGIGIDRHQVARLFEPFSQADDSTSRKFGGTGLGLSISRQLAQLMGGKLSAVSKPGEGSTFFFRLPFAHATSAVPRKNNSINAHHTLREARVLVIDDNAMTLKVLRDILKSLSFHVTSLSTGKQALELLEQGSQQFDIVLVDWRMPGLDGETVSLEIGRIFANRERPIVVLMTAFGAELIEHKINRDYIDGVLVKPITASNLFNMLANIKHGNASGVATDNVETPPLTPLKGHVILAEDNPINQQIAQEILKQMGLEVTLCGDGLQVLDTLEHTHPDLILMDIQMPEMDGYEATRRIRQQNQFKALPILAMTANAMADDVTRSLDAGMQFHISKPIDPIKLHQILSRYLPGPKSPARAKPETSATAQTGDPLPELLDGINLRRGITQIGGNETLYRKLLQDFINNHGGSHDVLRSTLERGEIETAKRLAHTIKGVAANIGAQPLSDAAAQIDRQLKRNQSVDQATLDQYTSTNIQIMDSLKPLFQNQQPPAVSSGATPAGSAELEALADSLNQGNASSRQLLEQLLPEIEQTFGQDLATRLTDLVGQYEYEEAGALLETAIEQPHEH